MARPDWPLAAAITGTAAWFAALGLLVLAGPAWSAAHGAAWPAAARALALCLLQLACILRAGTALAAVLRLIALRRLVAIFTQARRP